MGRKYLLGLGVLVVTCTSLVAVEVHRSVSMRSDKPPAAGPSLVSLSSLGEAPKEDCDIVATPFSEQEVESSHFGQIRFHQGSYIQNDELGNADWDFVLEAKSTIYTFGPDTIRMISVIANHLRGSGSWYVALGYRCLANQARKVIEVSSLAPITITRSGEDELEFATWQEYRGASFPSGGKIITAHWNKYQGKFLVD